MSIKFVVNGMPIEVSDPIEAATLIKALGIAVPPEGASAPTQTAVQKPQRRQSSKKTAQTPPLPESVNTAVADLATRFLETIRNSGKIGVSADQLMPIFGVEHAKGLGSKMAGVNKLLKTLGHGNLAAVYTNPRTPNGRIWRAGKRINDALASLSLLGLL